MTNKFICIRGLSKYYELLWLFSLRRIDKDLQLPFDLPELKPVLGTVIPHRQRRALRPL